MRLAYSYAVRLIHCTCDGDGEDKAPGSGPRQITDGYNRSCICIYLYKYHDRRLLEAIHL